MGCDYTHLNHNSLMSLKQMATKGVMIKGFIVKSCLLLSIMSTQTLWWGCQIVYIYAKYMHVFGASSWFTTCLCFHTTTLGDSLEIYENVTNTLITLLGVFLWKFIWNSGNIKNKTIGNPLWDGWIGPNRWSWNFQI